MNLTKKEKQDFKDYFGVEIDQINNHHYDFEDLIKYARYSIESNAPETYKKIKKQLK